MTYAFTYDVPIGAETYARIKDGLGPERPDGLIAHLAWRTESPGCAMSMPGSPRTTSRPSPRTGCTLSCTRFCRRCSASCRPSRSAPCSTSSTSGPTGIPADHGAR